MEQVETAGAAAARDDQRPTWRRIVDFPLVALIIAVVLFLVANAAALFVIKNLLPPMDRNLGSLVKATINIGFALALYKFAIVRLGEHQHDDLPLAGAPKGFTVGFLIGFGIFAAVVGIAALLDVYNVAGPGNTRDLVVAFIGLGLVPAFMEELLFRGIMFRWIEELGGSWTALLLTSLLFGLSHIVNPNATWFSSAAIAIEAGLLLGAAYMLTRNLWLPIGLHAGWNFTQGEVFDVPVSGIDQHGLVTATLSGPTLLSGGAFGLEASVIGLGATTAVGLWFLVRAIREGELVQPWWVRRRLARSDPVA